MTRFDVVVVLGAALTRDGRLGPALAERVEAAVTAWKAGLAPLLLMTGAREAGAMKRRAVEKGVPADAILVEQSARTTRENALFSRELMRAQGLARAAVVTQSYHRRRSVAAFRHAGVDAEGLEFESRPARLPARLRERVAWWVYRLRGWV